MYGDLFPLSNTKKRSSSIFSGKKDQVNTSKIKKLQLPNYFDCSSLPKRNQTSIIQTLI
jgi:hypothetical protein